MHDARLAVRALRAVRAVRPLRAAALLAAPLLGGCVEPVVLGGEGGGGEGGGVAAITTGAGVTSTGQTVAGSATATAGVTSAASTGSGGPSLNTTATTRWITPDIETAMCASSSPCDIPDASILLVLDSKGPVCELPLQRDYPSGAGFRVSLSLPPEVQIEGTYVLQDSPGILVHRGEEYSGGSTNGATVGGGFPGMGTIEILSIDDLQMTVRATGLTGLDELDSDGDYVTAPCE